MKLKLLCIGDSMGLPREGVAYEDTWFFNIKNFYKDYEFIPNFQRAATTNVLGNYNKDYLEYYEPNVVILQLGIVDCAPRLLNRRGLIIKIVNNLPMRFQNLFFRILKKLKKRSQKCADVSITSFEENLELYLKRCKENEIYKIILIKICLPDEQFINKNPQIANAVSAYNAVLDKLEMKFENTVIINPLNSGLSSCYVDGYHPNALGNNLVFSQLKEVIKCLN